MPWIKTVDEAEASGEVKAIYDASLKLYGFVPNIRKALSLNPTALRAYTQLSGAVYHGGILAPEEREMIATVVSAANRCHY
ncbi:MAG: carboxymuconolactone decarboxylase family protein [Acidobacteria bacterium]|nr:carboxymuconolactone decarboxylase family protein [Acidobacteriota bacterium]